LKSQITHTHETSGESGVLSDLAIDGDVAFLVVDDHGDFSASQSVLKTVPNQEIQLGLKRLSLLQDDSEGKGFSVFVGTLRGLSGLKIIIGLPTFQKDLRRYHRACQASSSWGQRFSLSAS